MRRLFYILAGLSLLITACDLRMAVEVEDWQLKQTDPFLVIHSFISPQDSLIKVSVTESIPRSGKMQSFYLSDAKVEMSKGTDTVSLAYLPGSGAEQGMYAISAREFTVEPGKTYTLKVTASDGRVVTSSCRVPDKAPDFQVSFIKYTSGEYYDPRWEKYGANLSWKDFEGETNYYRFVHQYADIYEGEDTTLWEKPSYERPPFYDDAQGQGTTFQLESPAYNIMMITDENSPDPQATILDFYILNCDQAYYDHHKRLYGTGSRGESLFDRFKEPSQVPSNIEGGAGIFAAFNGSKQRFIIEKANGF